MEVAAATDSHRGSGDLGDRRRERRLLRHTRAIRNWEPGPATNRDRWTRRATFEARFAEVEHRFAGGPVPRPPHWGGYRVTPGASSSGKTANTAYTNAGCLSATERGGAKGCCIRS
ncbi:MAG: hypothetical protein QM811_04870 [Pirellulales bacterium]